ncbi:MAG: hypothetical protein AABZ47_08535 [Planctomycetota bacterium]
MAFDANQSTQRQRRIRAKTRAPVSQPNPRDHRTGGAGGGADLCVILATQGLTSPWVTFSRIRKTQTTPWNGKFKRSSTVEPGFLRPPLTGRYIPAQLLYQGLADLELLEPVYVTWVSPFFDLNIVDLVFKGVALFGSLQFAQKIVDCTPVAAV